MGRVRTNIATRCASRSAGRDCRCVTSRSLRVAPSPSRDRRASRRFAGGARATRLPKKRRRSLVPGRGTCPARTAGVVTAARHAPTCSARCARLARWWRRNRPRFGTITVVEGRAFSGRGHRHVITIAIVESRGRRHVITIAIVEGRALARSRSSARVRDRRGSRLGRGRDRRASRRYAGGARSTRLPKNRRRLLVPGRGTCRARTTAVVTAARPAPTCFARCARLARWWRRVLAIVEGRALGEVAIVGASSRSSRVAPWRGRDRRRVFAIVEGRALGEVAIVGLRGATQVGRAPRVCRRTADACLYRAGVPAGPAPPP